MESTPSKVDLFLPPYLQMIGYSTEPVFQKLAEYAITFGEKGIVTQPAWGAWRGILEYISCAEYARHTLLSLPTGKALGSVDAVPAMYNSKAKLPAKRIRIAKAEL